jgi:hypothetical protein
MAGRFDSNTQVVGLGKSDSSLEKSKEHVAVGEKKCKPEYVERLWH